MLRRIQKFSRNNKVYLVAIPLFVLFSVLGWLSGRGATTIVNNPTKTIIVTTSPTVSKSPSASPSQPATSTTTDSNRQGSEKGRVVPVKPRVTTKPQAVAPKPSTQPTYKTCAEAGIHVKLPLLKGDVGFSTNLDRDHDGVACE